MGNCIKDGQNSKSKVKTQKTSIISTGVSKRILPETQSTANPELCENILNREENVDSCLLLPEALIISSKNPASFHQKQQTFAATIIETKQSDQTKTNFKEPLYRQLNRLQDQSQSDGDCMFTYNEGICEGKQNKILKGNQNDKTEVNIHQNTSSLNSKTIPLCWNTNNRPYFRSTRYTQ